MLRIFLSAVFVILFPIHFGFCASEDSDKVTTEELRLEGLKHPEQTTFKGLTELLASGRVGDGKNFGVEFALAQFKPFTPSQVKAVIAAIRSPGFYKQERLSLTAALIMLLLGQIVDQEGLTSLQQLRESAIDLSTQRVIARIRLHQNRGDASAIALLWQIAQPFVARPLDSPHATDVDPMLATLDLLLSTDQKKAQDILLQKSESVTAAQELVFPIGHFYSAAVGSDVIRRIFVTLKDANLYADVGNFVTALSGHNLPALARVHDVIADGVPCEVILAAFGAQAGWQNNTPPTRH